MSGVLEQVIEEFIDGAAEPARRANEEGSGRGRPYSPGVQCPSCSA